MHRFHRRRSRDAFWRFGRLFSALLLLTVSTLIALGGTLPADADDGGNGNAKGEGVGRGRGKAKHELRPAPVGQPRGEQKRQQEPRNKATVTSNAAAVAGKNAVDPIDLKILLISADGNETSLPAMKAFLDQLGTPYTTFVAFNQATRAKTPLTASFLWDGALHGYYQAVIMMTGNMTYLDPTTGNWQSAFDSNDWAVLWDYESRFAIRQVTAETYPGWPEADNFGLSVPPVTRDTTASPIVARLTTAGQQAFPYLRSTSPITITGAYAYLSTVANASVATPVLLSDPDPQNGGTQYAIASIAKHADGRENLTINVGHNATLLHSVLMSYGIVNWATKGFFLGERHSFMDYQPDDILIDDDIWDTRALTDTTGVTYRMTGADLTAALNWQNRVRANANTSTFRIEWPFNCEGATGIYSPDTLTAAVKNNRANFNWISHTYTHFNLDAPATAAQVQNELTQNQNCASSRLSLTYGTNFYKDAMIQPDISGLYNAAAFTGAYNFGIRTWISDTSRAGWDNPTPNAGFYRGTALTNSQTPISPAPSILVIPRKPTNLFYNLSTPQEWVSEYNCYYSKVRTDPTTGLSRNPNCLNGHWAIWDRDQTYAEILDKESDLMLRYLLTWSLDPVMFHQPNVRAYDGTRSLFSDLVDATLTKYNSMVNLPIINLTQHDVGLRLAARMNYNQAGVTAKWDRNKTITITAVKAADVPVTGIATGTKQERYGNQPISTISVGAGKTVTITLASVPPSP